MMMLFRLENDYDVILDGRQDDDVIPVREG